MEDIQKDIKIIEEFIKDPMPEYREVIIHGEKIKFDYIPMNFRPDKKLAQAIQNLLQAYKEGEAVIEEMARWIFDKDYIENSLLIHRDDYYSNCIKQVKEYFKTK